MLVLALGVLALGLAAGLPLILPDTGSLAFVERHYFRPFVVALVLQALVLGVGRVRRDVGRRVRELAPTALLLVFTIAIHFNLKAWTPLVHARLFDVELMRTDIALAPLVSACVALRHLVTLALARWGLSPDPLYHGLFVALFFAAFSAHAVFDTLLGLRRVVLAACLVLLVGGVAYWVFPAEGPFLYRLGESRLAEDAQRAMTAAFTAFVRTHRPPPGYFTAPLAAMPSLHVAHATVFTTLAWRRFRALGLVFALVLAWLVVEAVASGWHYVLDIPAGALLAAGCLWLTDRLLPGNAADERLGA